VRDAIVIAGKLTIKVLSRWTRHALAEVLEAGALYFDAVSDRTRKPVKDAGREDTQPTVRRDDDHDPTKCNICRTNRGHE